MCCQETGGAHLSLFNNNSLAHSNVAVVVLVVIVLVPRTLGSNVRLRGKSDNNVDILKVGKKM